MLAPGTVSLVPGTPISPTFPLARYRQPELEGVVRAFVASATQPGDLVLAIGAVDGRCVTEAVMAGRRLVALGRNPVDLLCAALAISPVSPEQAQTALTRLGDQSKGGLPLVFHIRERYRSRCPHCHAQGTAAWFAWDRDRGQPYAKRVLCPECDQPREGPVDSDDLAEAGSYPPRTGIAYHLALHRAAGHLPDQQARIDQLIRCYTPRNLSVLMDIIQHMPRRATAPDTQRVVDAIVLDALDAGSTLLPIDAPESKPKSLTPPQRFLERNLWLVLEAAMVAYAAEQGPLSGSGSSHVPRRESLTGLLTTPEPGCLLLNQSIQALCDATTRNQFSALIVHLAPPDATFWALAVLWSMWLWGNEVPEDLRGFLRRRRLDWDWYQQSLARALSAARPLLTPRAPILVTTPQPGLDGVRAIVYAANANGLHLDRWLTCPPHGHRALMHFTDTEPSTRATARPSQAVETDVILADLLTARGEPTDRRTLAALATFATRRPDLSPPSAAPSGPITTLGEDRLWLRTPEKPAHPLADQVEDAVYQRLMTEDHEWTPADLVSQLTAEFHSARSPEPALIQTVIEAYTIRDERGNLLLRTEDMPQHRREEEQALRRQLTNLGRRLGYSPAKRLGGDLVWREERAVPYLFRFTATALLAPHLLTAQPRCDGRRCLVLPGGRAALVALKLRRDPRLAHYVTEYRWTFIKYRHLRRMIDRIHERGEIEVYLGLDPIVEQQTAQIPLPLHVEARR